MTYLGILFTNANPPPSHPPPPTPTPTLHPTPPPPTPSKTYQLPLNLNAYVFLAKPINHPITWFSSISHANVLTRQWSIIFILSTEYMVTFILRCNWKCSAIWCYSSVWRRLGYCLLMSTWSAAKSRCCAELRYTESAVTVVKPPALMQCVFLHHKDIYYVWSYENTWKMLVIYNQNRKKSTEYGIIIHRWNIFFGAPSLYLYLHYINP